MLCLKKKKSLTYFRMLFQSS